MEEDTQERLDEAWAKGVKHGREAGKKTAVKWLRERAGKLFAERKDAEAKSIRDVADLLEATPC